MILFCFVVKVAQIIKGKTGQSDVNNILKHNNFSSML